MRWKAAGRAGWVTLGVFAALAFAVGALRTHLIEKMLLSVAGRVVGVSIVADSSSIGLHAADFSGLVVRSTRGEPIARVAQLSLSYDLRDALLPGGKRLFGLSAVRIERPQLTVIHRPDSSYNIPLQSFSSGSSGAGPPLVADVRVIDGSVEVIDQTRVDPATRHLYIVKLELDAHLDTAARSRYTASLAYREDGRDYPIQGAGDSDVASGLRLHHFRATELPVARLLDYGIDSSQTRARRSATRSRRSLHRLLRRV